MKGGSIRGEGRYGCVFQPRLKCKDKAMKSSDSQKVGKITQLIDAKNELMIGEYLKSIPNSSTYTVYVEHDSCIPDAASEQSDQDLNKCELIHSTNLKDTVQLTMPWGGYSLSRIDLKPTSFNFFKVFEQILAIGSFILLNDICHFDISVQNILVDSKQTPKLIDFGFSFRGSKLKKEHLKNIWRKYSYDHDVETPEITLVLSANKGVPVEHSINELERQKPAVQRLATLCGVSPSKWGQDLKAWSDSSIHLNKHEWYEIFKIYWPGFDSWSLGAVVLILLEIQLSFQSFITSSEWTERGELVKEVLRGMCNANPIQRLDAAEALHLFTKGSHPLFTSASSSSSAASLWISEKKKNRLALL
jgi:serine/threonine protein kinase